MDSELQVEYVPFDVEFELEFGTPEYGSFRFRVCDGVDCLRSWAKYNIRMDRDLAEWLSGLRRPDSMDLFPRVPAEFDERARGVVAELLQRDSAIEVACRACGRTYAVAGLIHEAWNTSLFVE